jgi:hypothetical protein
LRFWQYHIWQGDGKDRVTANSAQLFATATAQGCSLNAHKEWRAPDSLSLPADGAARIAAATDLRCIFSSLPLGEHDPRLVHRYELAADDHAWCQLHQRWQTGAFKTVYDAVHGPMEARDAAGAVLPIKALASFTAPPCDTGDWWVQQLDDEHAVRRLEHDEVDLRYPGWLP